MIKSIDGSPKPNPLLYISPRFRSAYFSISVRPAACLYVSPMIHPFHPLSQSWSLNTAVAKAGKAVCAELLSFKIHAFLRITWLKLKKR